MIKYHVYTDGGCRPNPGAGASGLVFVEADTNKNAYSKAYFKPNTTNNIMELTAAINVFKIIERSKTLNNADITIFTDSNYVKQGITNWIHNWIKSGKLIDGKSTVIKNPELWWDLYQYTLKYKNVKFQWVKAHSVNEWNNFVDELCTKCIKENTKSDF